MDHSTYVYVVGVIYVPTYDKICSEHKGIVRLKAGKTERTTCKTITIPFEMSKVTHTMVILCFTVE